MNVRTPAGRKRKSFTTKRQSEAIRKGHDLRHTAAILKNKVDVRTVAEILGHKGPAMTLRKYAHLLSDMQDDTASRMDQVLY